MRRYRENVLFVDTTSGLLCGFSEIVSKPLAECLVHNKDSKNVLGCCYCYFSVM